MPGYVSSQQTWRRAPLAALPREAMLPVGAREGWHTEKHGGHAQLTQERVLCLQGFGQDWESSLHGTSEHHTPWGVTSPGKLWMNLGDSLPNVQLWGSWKQRLALRGVRTGGDQHPPPSDEIPLHLVCGMDGEDLLFRDLTVNVEAWPYLNTSRDCNQVCCLDPRSPSIPQAPRGGSSLCSVKHPWGQLSLLSVSEAFEFLTWHPGRCRQYELNLIL